MADAIVNIQRLDDSLIGELNKQIDVEIFELRSKMLLPVNNYNVYCEQLKNRLNYLKWVNQNWDLRSENKPKMVLQKEIFYCELGVNIGSEQSLHHPVAIMQNNLGNKYGDTTIVVPITTYDGSEFYDKDGIKYIKYTKDGQNIDRQLDFYEVYIEIKPGFKEFVYGVANVTHTREISQRRLKKTPVATLTDATYNKIIQALNKNLTNIQK